MANVPYAIGNKNPRNKNSTIIELDASVVCVHGIYFYDCSGYIGR